MHPYKVKSTTGTTVSAFQLTPEIYEAIGRVVRACAVIEELADLHFCRLSRLGRGQALMVLGRMSLSGKLRIAERFADGAGPAALAMFKEAFRHPAFDHLFDFRNTVAHGELLGKTGKGQIAFQVKRALASDEHNVVVDVTAIPVEAFAEFAGLAEDTASRLEDFLMLRDWRRELRTQSLEPTAREEPRAAGKPRRKSRPSKGRDAADV